MSTFNNVCKLQVVKPFLEPKTYNKVKFVYQDDLNTKKIMEDLFDMDMLESSFGGNNHAGFDINTYAERMKEDDEKMIAFLTKGNPLPNSSPSFVSTKLGMDCEASEDEKSDSSRRDSEAVSPDHCMPVATSSRNLIGDVHEGKLMT